MTLAGLSVAFGLVLTGQALAAPGSGSDGVSGGQAEWVQKYDADAGLTVPRTTTPILSPQTVAATEDAIERYQQIIDKGGWNQVPANQTLKLGSKGGAVVDLRRRLAASGDLDPTVGSAEIFDSYVEAAVKKFQARHGLGTTGIVNDQTFDALNIPADVRLQQLEINLVRLRTFSGNLGNRYVTLNIPAASVETVENGMVVSHHEAGVGKIDRQSPVMQAKAIEINFNPFWTVPASIIRKDLIPRMQANPNYLTENHIRMINKEGQEVPPDSINWNSLDAVNYRFRQDPGGDYNSLGFVRVNIPNPYGVYMHDTPEKGIFGDDFRFVSSGCVRVQNIRDYAAWLLEDNPGWDRDHIDQVIASGERVDVKLTQPVNVYWVYVTAWANDGLVQFRDDIYHRDGFEPATGSVATAASSGDGQMLQPMSDVQ
jgi:murein L,D-transpeptidase YcbB/YkuD